MASNVAVHTISFRGKAGAIFVILCVAIVLFLVAFISHGWAFNETTRLRLGLWEECTCQLTKETDKWFNAVRGMLSVGLLALFIAFLLISIYMCVHTVSKNSTIIALVCVCFLAAVFMIIGFIIYAVEITNDGNNLSWSFALCVLSSVLCLIAGIISVVQLRSSGVRV
jgi:hypothetical protein